MAIVISAWDTVVLHPMLATVNDWFLVGLTVVVLLALLAPAARRFAV
jgi:hypothetical protein